MAIGVLNSPNVSAPAIRDDPPVTNDWGMVVRPIGTGALQAWQTAQVAVGLAAVQVAAVPIALRRGVSLRAACVGLNAEIFVGATAAVTILTGTGLKDRETISMDLDDTIGTTQIWAIATAVGQTLYVTEIAAT
jgi:hypothetical protein